jgi:hypothetical protein
VLPRSWTWLHGEPIGVLNIKNEVIKHWLCRECYQDNVHHPLSTYLLNVEKKTNKPLDHLEQVHHYDRFCNKLGQSMSKKRKYGSIKPWLDQSTTNNTIFDNAGWKTTYIRWVVSSGISLRQAASPEYNALLCFMNPRIEDLVPRYYRTVTNWIDAEFLERKASIVRSIANSKGKVTISFDGWKANNDVLDLLGVVVHYLGDDYKVHNVVLTMRDTLSSHTGANIADQLFDVLKDY